MKYTINIGGNGEIQVDYLEYGVVNEGSVEGWPEIYITVRDSEMDIYTNAGKRKWIEWLNDNCGHKSNPEKRILKVVAKVMGNGGEVYRTIEITEAYLAGYTEQSMDANHSYSATIRRAPSRQSQINLLGGEA
jgi:5-keto 4-deoxyuronate isomerase